MIDAPGQRLTAGFGACAGRRCTMLQVVTIAVAPPFHLQPGAAIDLPMLTFKW